MSGIRKPKTKRVTKAQRREEVVRAVLEQPKDVAARVIVEVMDKQERKVAAARRAEEQSFKKYGDRLSRKLGPIRKNLHAAADAVDAMEGAAASPFAAEHARAAHALKETKFFLDGIVFTELTTVGHTRNVF